MSFDKPKTSNNEKRKVIKTLAPAVLAFFAGHYIEEKYGNTDYETKNISSELEARTSNMIISTIQKVKEFKKNLHTSNFHAESPVGDVDISYGPDDTLIVSRRDIGGSWSQAESSVFKIDENYLYYAKGKNLDGRWGDVSTDFTVHYKWNNNLRKWQLANAQTMGKEGEVASIAEQELGEDLLLLSYISATDKRLKSKE